MNTKFALLVAAGLAGTAAANTYNGAGFNFPDNLPAGASSSIVVGDSFGITGLTVTLNDAAHTWVGDLIATLTHTDSNTSVILFNRPGFTGTGFGFSWNLLGNYTFDDGAAQSFQAIGVQPTTFNLPSGSYLAAGSLGSFNGLDAAGTWTLSISDNAAGDLGGIGSWTLNIVPAPSAMALLGMGGLMAARRRR